jgi:hypothetical protein
MATAYQFKCGAKQTHQKNGFRVTMHYEGGVYHVSAYCDDDANWYKSKLFHTLKDAKKQFSRYKRIVNL